MKSYRIEVTVSLPSVQETKMQFSADTTIKELKTAICEKLKLESDYTNLIVEGTVLDAENTVGNLDLQNKKIVVDYLWARHLLLWNSQQQSRIRDSTVLIAGAGALGNEVAKNLAMMGVKRLVIVDYDVVEVSNVSRMFLFGIDDIGKPKAEVLGAQIVQKYPFVEATAYNCILERLPLDVFLNSDVIVSGLDNIASRIFLAAVAVKYQIPMVDGGTMRGYETRVQVYIPTDTACPACNLPADQYAKLVNLKNPCDPKIEEGKTPSVVTANSYTASIQAQETVKIIMGREEFKHEGKWPQNTGQPLQGILIADLKFNKYSTIQLKKNPRCLVCGEKGMAKPVKKHTLRFEEIGNSTSNLYDLAEHLIGTTPQLYTIANTSPTKIPQGQGLSELGIHKGSHIIAITSPTESDFTETLLKIA